MPHCRWTILLLTALFVTGGHLRSAQGQPTKPDVGPSPRPSADASAIPSPSAPPPRRVRPRAKRNPVFDWRSGYGLDIAPLEPFPQPVVPRLRGLAGSLELHTIVQGRLVIPLRGAAPNYQTRRGHFVGSALPGGLGGLGALAGFRGEQNVSFEATHLRFILLGTVLVRHLRYAIQYDPAEGLGAVDVRLAFHLPWVPGLTISAGRVVPNGSLMATRLVSRRETVELPIFLTEGGFGGGRDVGLEIRYSRQLGRAGILSGYFGVWNGEPNRWTDQNDMKDFSFRLDFRGAGRLHGFLVGAHVWLGYPLCHSGRTCIPREAERKHFDSHIRSSLFFEWQQSFGLAQPHLMGEAYVGKFIPRAKDAERHEVLSSGGWLQVSVLIGHLLEPLVRGELLHFSRRSDAPLSTLDLPVAKTSYAARVTAGFQLWLRPISSIIRLNYIFQYMPDASLYAGEPQWIDLDIRDGLTSPTQIHDVHLLLLEISSEF